MIQLRPPTDPDNFRVKAGRFGDRFYVDPLPADDTWEADDEDHVYPAISTVKKAVGQDWTRAAMKRMAKAPSQLVEIAGLDSEFERKERLNLLSDAGLDQAAGRGTIVHQHFEAKLGNRLPIYQMNEVVKPYIRTAETFLAAYNPRLVAAEFVAIHRTLNREGVGRKNEWFGFGGTGDAVIEIDGLLYMVDWKSRAEDSPHKAYSEEAGQVSAYGKADYWIVGDPESPTGVKRIEPLELAGGLIVSIKPDSYECFPIDLDAGFDYWTDLHAWWQARRSERLPVKRKWAPRVVPEGASQLEPEVEYEVTRRQEIASKATLTAAPTPASNRVRFDALPDIKKGWARDVFKRKGLNPNDPATAGEVSRLLGEIEHRPTVREMQETKARQEAERRPDPNRCPSCGAVSGTAGPPDSDHCDDRWHGPLPPKVDPMEAEGGEAPDELISESRLLFDLVIGEHGKEWTGFRVREANVAEVPFQVSRLRSVKRAQLYLALTKWAQFRGETLKADEAEGNIEFSSILTMVDDYAEDTYATLGRRLGALTADQAEKFATLVDEVVQSESGDQPVADSETTNNQPASEPASD